MERVRGRPFCVPSEIGTAVHGAADFIEFAMEMSCTAADTPLTIRFGKAAATFCKSTGRRPIFSNSIFLEWLLEQVPGA